MNAVKAAYQYAIDQGWTAEADAAKAKAKAAAV